MPTPSPIYVNINGLVEQPDSRQVTRSYQSRSTTIIYEGKYANCLASLPNIGAADAGEIITAAHIEPLHGGMAKLHYTRELRNANYTYEVTWQQTQLDLKMHKRYRPGGAKELTEKDLANIESWKACFSDPEYWQYVEDLTLPPDSTALSANAQDFAKKYKAGMDSFLIFSPIARRTRIDYIILTTGSCLGTAQSGVPFVGCPPGYKWLKIADNATYESGFWHRTEEWQGQYDWDEDIYGAGAA